MDGAFPQRSTTEAAEGDGALVTPAPPFLLPKLRWTVRLLTASAVCAASSYAFFVLELQVGSEGLLTAGYAASWASFFSLLGASFFAVRSAGEARRAEDRRSRTGRARSLVASIAALMGFFVAFLTAVAPFIIRGRQVRSFGRPVLARVIPSRTWLERATSNGANHGLSRAVPEDAGLRAALAAAWRENGRTEHASVAAFARLSLDLLALGAPSHLVASANRDALDEIRHAELCFSLARDLDGRAESPAAFPQAKSARGLPSNRTLALSQLAVDSLIDGALNEGFSARVVAGLARESTIPAIRAVLKEIAADEGRHCAHGWDVVAWCVEVGGDPVRAALLGALAALATDAKPSANAQMRDGAWRAYGLPSHALEQDAFVRTRADVVARVHRLVRVPVPVAAT